MKTKSELSIAEQRLQNRIWRLNNLYYIVDKGGKKRLFQLNWAQKELYNQFHYCNIVLKARQLGISTFMTVLFLDVCLFNSNVSAGIIAHTKEDAQQIFQKVKFAYDNLPESLKTERIASTDTVGELRFSNDSLFRIGTSLRSSTFQYLHISEFGKICAKYPEKAREIITGALNTLATGQYVIIESTAEGREGAFYDMCKKTQEMKAQNMKLSPLDFRFHFFPWWREPSYRLEHWLQIPSQLQEYFDKLKVEGITLCDAQKFWYVAKHSTQGADMLREYPSTPEEAFLASSEGLYYGQQLVLARAEQRIGNVPYDSHAKTYTAWDLGFADATAIWVYQLVNKEIRLIEYIEDFGKPLTYYLELLKKKSYIYEKHFVPHDAAVHELTTGQSRIEVARDLGFAFTIANRLPLMDGIDQTRNVLNRCWFDKIKCSKGISALENYKKEWNEKGYWEPKPFHNFASHGADAFRILAITLKEAERKGLTAEKADKLYYESRGYYDGGFFNNPAYGGFSA